jgi:hypothetical protein
MTDALSFLAPEALAELEQRGGRAGESTVALPGSEGDPE